MSSETRIGEKIFLSILYLSIAGIFILGLLCVLWNTHRIQTVIIVCTLVACLFVPVGVIFQIRLHKSLIVGLGLGVLYTLYYSFSPNTATDGRYELRNLPPSGLNFNLLHGISERELLETGFFLSGLLGISQSQLASFQTKELQYEDSYPIQLPSMIPNAIINKKEQKYILHTPKDASKENLIIVLHGNAGGFLFYQKYFNNLASEYHTRVAMPIWGWGNWNENGGTQLIFRTYEDLLKRQEITPSTRVILIGFSNGGKGLTRSVYYDSKQILSSVVSISGVLEESIVKQKAFQSHAKNINFLVIHGEKDDRVRYNTIKNILPLLPNQKTLIFPSGDHFIGISEDGAVQKAIRNVLIKRE